MTFKYLIPKIIVLPKMATPVFEYPRWKHHIPDQPTEDQYRKAWKQLFEYYPDECICFRGDVEIIGLSLTDSMVIKTPTSTIFHGGFCEYTDSPVLGMDDSFFYKGGCSWNTDLIGQRYYEIDDDTNMPMDWEDVRSLQIVINYLKAQK